jgi:tetratricopeptide (TPR) repeat protein
MNILCSSISLFSVYILFSTTAAFAQMPESYNIKDSSKHQLRQLLLSPKVNDTVYFQGLVDFCAKEVAQHPDLSIEAAKQGAALSRNWRPQTYYGLFVHIRLKALNNKGQFIEVVKLKDSLDNLSDLTVPEVNRLEWIAEFGKAYYKLGKIDKLVLLYKEGIKDARRSGLYTYEIQQLNNLAIAYNSIGQVQTAIIFLEEALQLSRQRKIASEEARCLINLSHFETNRQNFGNSIQLLKSLLEKADVARNKSMSGLILSNMSWNYYQMQDYPNALDFCRQALYIRREIQDSAGYARGIGILARIQLKLGAIDSARSNDSQALEMVRHMQIISDVRDNYETLSGINEQTGNYKAVLLDFRQFLYWKDSALRQERDAQLKGELLSLQYEELETVKRAYQEQEGWTNIETNMVIHGRSVDNYYLFICSIGSGKEKSN